MVDAGPLFDVDRVGLDVGRQVITSSSPELTRDALISVIKQAFLKKRRSDEALSEEDQSVLDNIISRLKTLCPNPNDPCAPQAPPRPGDGMFTMTTRHNTKYPKSLIMAGERPHDEDAILEKRAADSLHDAYFYIALISILLFVALIGSIIICAFVRCRKRDEQRQSPRRQSLTDHANSLEKGATLRSNADSEAMEYDRCCPKLYWLVQKRQHNIEQHKRDDRAIFQPALSSTKQKVQNSGVISNSSSSSSQQPSRPATGRFSTSSFGGGSGQRSQRQRKPPVLVSASSSSSHKSTGKRDNRLVDAPEWTMRLISDETPSSGVNTTPFACTTTTIDSSECRTNGAGVITSSSASGDETSPRTMTSNSSGSESNQHASSSSPASRLLSSINATPHSSRQVFFKMANNKITSKSTAESSVAALSAPLAGQESSSMASTVDTTADENRFLMMRNHDRLLQGIAGTSSSSSATLNGGPVPSASLSNHPSMHSGVLLPSSTSSKRKMASTESGVLLP